MKLQENEELAAFSKRGSVSQAKEQMDKKVHNAAMKKFYEGKLASLADRSLPVQLLKMMCQDAPVQANNLDSKWGRKWYVRRCAAYYQRRLKEIQRSEKTGFFSFFS